MSSTSSTKSPWSRLWRIALWVIIALIVAFVSYGILVLGGR